MKTLLIGFMAYGFVVTFLWFLALLGSAKERNDLLLEIELLQNRLQEDPKLDVMRELIDSTRAENERLKSELEVVGDAMDTVVEVVAELAWRQII